MRAVACILKPQRQIVVVETLRNKLWISALIGSATYDLLSFLCCRYVWLTVWRRNVGHVSIVSRHTSQEADARGTANGNCAVVARVVSALINDVFLELWHVVERVQMQILIICDDEENVWTIVMCMVPG